MCPTAPPQSLLEAPADMPDPIVKAEPLRTKVKMALFHPTARYPGMRLWIAVLPRAVQRAEAGMRLDGLGEPAREAVHYMLLLGEKGWNGESPVFSLAQHHHCGPEFQRLTEHTGPVIWNFYHSAKAVRAINDMVQRSGSVDGHQIGKTTPGSKYGRRAPPRRAGAFLTAAGVPPAFRSVRDWRVGATGIELVLPKARAAVTPAQCQPFDFALLYLPGRPSAWETLEEGNNDVGFICT